VSRRTLVNLGFFAALFAVMILWALNNVVHLRSYERPYPVKGDFESAVGVRGDSEVAYLGVHYGSVRRVKSIPGGVEITMDIDRHRLIPKGSTANIARKSAIGEPYVNFVPPANFDPKTATASSYLTKDTVIPMKDTTIPLEFSELLRSASRLVSGIDPAKAGSLIHELALALNGRAQSLRDLTTNGDELAATFAAKTDVLDRLARNNTILTHVLAEHRLSLGQSLTNLKLLADSLKNASGDTATVLDQGSQLFTIVANLVSDEKGNLDCILKDLVPVIDMTTTDAELQGLATLLEQGYTGFHDVFLTRDIESDGVWVRVNLIVNPNDPAPAYAPPGKALPAVPAIPACTSTVPPGTTGPHDVTVTDLLGGSGAGGAGETTARTGADAMGWLAAILVLTAAAFRWLGRKDDEEVAR
jgi:phospholipid/cholesterol/gamma-HCH transport system substrate-binding protein